MSTTTVSKLASALKLSNEKLIMQLNEAGIEVKDKDDVLSNDQKLSLLNHLSIKHQMRHFFLKKELDNPVLKLNQTSKKH